MVLGWTVGSLLLMSMIFGPTYKELSRTAAMFYTGLGKTAWSLGIAWFIVACACGRGGIVNRVLSAKCLLPYSRMSYTAYLINPLCIMFGVMLCEAPIHLDFLTLVCVTTTTTTTKLDVCAHALAQLLLMNLLTKTWNFIYFANLVSTFLSLSLPVAVDQHTGL